MSIIAGILASRRFPVNNSSWLDNAEVLLNFEDAGSVPVDKSSKGVVFNRWNAANGTNNGPALSSVNPLIGSKSLISSNMGSNNPSLFYSGNVAFFDHPINPLGGHYTIEFDFAVTNPTNSTARTTIFDIKDSGQSSTISPHYLSMTLSSNNASPDIVLRWNDNFNSSESTTLISVPLPGGYSSARHKLSICRDAGDNIKIFVDGQLAYTNQNANLLRFSGVFPVRLALCNSYNNSNGPGEEWIIDDFIILKNYVLRTGNFTPETGSIIP